MENHQKSHSSSKQQSWWLCKNIFWTKQVKNHFLAVHENYRLWKCEQCGEPFTKKLYFASLSEDDSPLNQGCHLRLLWKTIWKEIYYDKSLDYVLLITSLLHVIYKKNGIRFFTSENILIRLIKKYHTEWLCL